jgi:hypothetical protein
MNAQASNLFRPKSRAEMAVLSGESKDQVLMAASGKAGIQKRYLGWEGC